MTTRSLKNIFNNQFHALSREEDTSEAPLKSIVITLLNGLSDHKSAFGEHFWRTNNDSPTPPTGNTILDQVPSLKFLINKFFPFALSPLESNINYSLHGSVHFHSLFLGLEILAGVRFTSECRSRFTNFPRDITFIQQDIDSLEPKVLFLFFFLIHDS